MALYGTLGENDIAELSASISDTAVDVFVYDTRKDSDGGDWRKRTQHTSWYNETLNTSTRGSRKEFPAVAVLVLEQDQITIYDGDDPDLPMWMKFERDYSGSTKFLTSNRDNTSVTAINGIIAWCDTTDAQILKFIEDAMYLYGGGGLYSPNTGIANRNNTSAVNFTIIDDSVHIRNYPCNDIAMTVLPNAPIDSATGLPVPTIAVATNGGVSVIKDDGTVVDLNVVNRPYSSVYFSDDHLVWAVENPGGVTYDLLRYFEIPTADITTAPSYGPSSTPALFPTNTKGNISNSYAYGSPVGLTIIDHTDGAETVANSRVAYATTSYNTGYMHGDIKGAFLSDTDTTNVTGTELVTNGTFDTNTNGWFTVDANNTITRNGSGQAEVYRGGGSNVAGTLISMTSGVTYVITANIIQNGATTNNAEVLRLGINTTGYDRSVPGFGGSVTGIVATTYTPTDDIESLWIYAYPGNTTIIDDISVRVAELDRSVNNKGLQVFGTVTKSAVATGADLVGYSGFSASNYLQQPYNSDLNFGTGDFSIMFWYKATAGDYTSQCFLHRGDGGTGTWGSGKIIQIEFNSTNLAAFLSESAFSSFDTVAIPGATAASGQWQHYTLIRRGTFVGAYLDGELKNSTSSSRDLSNTSAKTWIGERPNLSRPLDTTSLALLRMSASAPSDEQIKKMYEDEKHLYQENAQATLYGSSDAVTALAYDDDTDLLYVGTSSGRSDFQGLRRINNTTTAVSTAISASNSLIVEQ